MNFLRTSWLNVALPFLFLLMACSKPPDVPKLPGAPPTESDRLVFGERLSIQDIKAIFRTLNKHGQFDAFASLFTQPSDAELEPIAALISKYLYQQVDWETGLVRQMDKRIAKKGFSDWLHKTKKWATERSYPELGNLALHALGDPHFPHLLNRGIPLLSTPFTKIWNRILYKGSTYEDRYAWIKERAPSADEYLYDVARITEKKPSLQLVQISHLIEKNSLGESFFRALSQLKKHYDGPIAFEGLAYGLRELLTTAPEREAPAKASRLALLLHFAKIADSSTDGFFAGLDKEFRKSPQQINFIGKFFQPLFTHPVFLRVQYHLSSKNFWQFVVPKKGVKQLNPTQRRSLYKRLEDAIVDIRGPIVSAGEDPFPNNLRTMINAFILSVFLEDWILKNHSTFLNLLELPEKKFAESLWRQNFPEFEKTYSLVEFGTPIQFPYHKAMAERFDNGETNETLLKFEQYVRSGVPGSEFPYEIFLEESSFSEALKEAIFQCDSVLSLGSASLFLTAITSLLAHEKTFSAFDSDNMMDSLHRILAEPLPLVRRLKNLLFEQLGFGRLDWEEVQPTVAPYFKNHPDFEKRFGGLIESMQPFYYFDKAIKKDLPTPFEVYHAWLRNSVLRQYGSPEDGAKAFTKMLHFLASNQLLDAEKNDSTGLYELEYPAVGGTILSARGLAATLYSLSQIEGTRPQLWQASEREIVLSVIRQAFGNTTEEGSGLAFLLEKIQAWIQEKPSGMRSLLSTAIEKGWKTLPDFATLTPEERNWLMQFVQKQDHTILWTFLHKHLDLKKALDVTHEMEQLIESGHFSQATTLLSHLKSRRLQFLAEVLHRWERSGELKALLQTVRTALVPLQKTILQTPISPQRRSLQIRSIRPSP